MPSNRDRDILIRTVIGEADGEGPEGQAAVAHVILNRTRDPRWPNSPAAVALQPKQFSTWNSGAGGNDLVRKYGPGSPRYEEVGGVVDAVLNGNLDDPTGGSTHYYSPPGMEALVRQGHQKNTVPKWFSSERKRAGGKVFKIGNHLFTGRAEGSKVISDIRGKIEARDAAAVDEEKRLIEQERQRLAQQDQDDENTAQPGRHPDQPDTRRFTFENSSPTTRFDMAQESANEQAKQELGYGGWAAMQDAASLEWGLGSLLNSREFKYDPRFEENRDEIIKELSDGLPSDWIADLSDAVSEEHARNIRAKLQEQMDAEKRLGSLGWKGVGLRVGAALLDPVALAAGVATDGIAAPLIAAHKASRLKRALLAGTAGGTAELGVTGVLDKDQHMDAQDYAFAAMGGFAIGGAFGATRRGLLAEEEAALSAMATQAHKDMLTAPPPDGKSVGAAQTNTEPFSFNKTSDEALQDAQGSPKTAFSGLRRVIGDAGGSLKSSKHPLVRKLGQFLAEDSVGNADHSRVPWTADLKSRFMYDSFEARFLRGTQKPLKSWYKEKGVSWYERPLKRKEFFSEVTDAIRDPHAEVSPQARQAAAEMRKLYDQYLDLGRNPGLREGRVMDSVAGFEHVEGNNQYINREYDHASLASAINEFEMSRVGDFSMQHGIDSLFARAIKELRPEMDDKLAVRMARWHVHRVAQAGHDADAVTMRALNGEDLDELKALLMDELSARDIEYERAFTTADEIEEIIKHLSKKPQSPSVKHARGRLLFDENFSMSLRTKYGAVRDVKIKDLLINDAEVLFQLYNRRMSGAVALASFGIRKKADIHKLIQQVKDTAPSVHGYSEQAMKRDVENLEFMLTMISGAPVGDYGRALFKERNSTSGQAMSIARDFMFIRLMNNMGIAQLPELGVVLGTMGMKTMLSAMPSFRGLLRNAKTGKLNDELLDELEAWTATGLDPLKAISFNRWDDFGNFVSGTEGQQFSRTRDGLEAGKRITAHISGMVAITAAFQRIAARAMAQKLAHMARGLGKMDKKRLASLGLTDVELDGIFRELNTKAEMVDGIRKGRLVKLNLDSWEPQARADFQMAIFRATRKMVQENDAGNLHRWMAKPLAQLFLQFRTFVLVGFWKQLAAGIHMKHDPATWVSFTLSSMIGGLVYTGQTYVNSIGRGDREEYLEENLTPRAIAAAAIERSSWSTILPMAVDSVWTLGADEGLFDTRSSGLSTGIGGNPTFDFLQKAYRATAGGVKAATRDDYDFSKSDAWAAYSLLMFHNAQGIRQGYNLITQDLPETSR
jgi:hypothetical protein